MGFTLEVGVCYIFPEPFELHPNVSLSEAVCRSNDSVTKNLKGHGRISRLWYFFTLQFSVLVISPKLFKRFFLITQMLPSVRRCAEPMTQLRTVKVKLTLKVMEFTL